MNVAVLEARQVIHLDLQRSQIGECDDLRRAGSTEVVLEAILCRFRLPLHRRELRIDIPDRTALMIDVMRLTDEGQLAVWNEKVLRDRLRSECSTEKNHSPDRRARPSPSPRALRARRSKSHSGSDT